MNKENEVEAERDAFIQAVERMVLQYQCIDFHQWHYWKNILQELDPYNPLLEVGFHGLPYTGGMRIKHEREKSLSFFARDG